MRNFITVCCLALFVGCGPAPEEVAEDPAAEESDDWWEGDPRFEEETL